MKCIVRMLLMVLMLSALELSAADMNLGIAVLDYKDDSRLAWDRKNDRPVMSHIFYPTSATTLEAVTLGKPGAETFLAGHAAWDAKPGADKKLPLVLMSHGTSGTALQMLWMAKGLVDRGYVVIGVNHHGNTELEAKKYAEGYALWWERTQDLEFVMNEVLKDKQWSMLIDENKVGVLGYSLGAYNAISAVGGITDVSLFLDYCKEVKCDPPYMFPTLNEDFQKVIETDLVQASLSKQSDSFRIDKVKAAVAIAPALVQAITEDSLRNINTPLMVVAGGDDQVAPLAVNTNRVLENTPGVTYVEVDKGSHFTFLSQCTDYGLKNAGIRCNDHEGLIRKEVHADLSKQMADFFHQAFK